MPRPLGTDRLETLPGGRLVLLARQDKGWRGRAEKTPLTPEHPGTAVRWEEQLFEVLDVDAAVGGGARYTLALWDERHAIRVAETYDLTNEDRRRREREMLARRQRQRWAALLVTPLLGCLPGKVQEAIENEIAIPATRMTFLSALLLLFFGAFSLVAMLIVVFGGPALLPTPVLLVGLYFWFESLGRLAMSMAQERPAGLFLAELVRQLWRNLRRRRKEAPAPNGETPEPAELVTNDSFLLLEPSLSLLDAREQSKLRDRFGFDGVLWGKVTAIVLLVGAAPLCFSAAVRSVKARGAVDLLILALSGTLVIEQIFRLRKLARGEVAPSVLRFLVGPLARLLSGSRLSLPAGLPK